MHQPFQRRIANKGLSAGAYADNYNIVALAWLRAFRSIAPIYRCIGLRIDVPTLCPLVTHDWLVFESAWIYANRVHPVCAMHH